MGDVDPGCGRSQVQALAASYRAFASQHPGCYAATIRAAPASQPDLTEAGDGALRVVFEVLTGWGLAGDDLFHAARTLRASIHGFEALEQGLRPS